MEAIQTQVDPVAKATLVPHDLQSFTAYAAKTVTEHKSNYPQIQEWLASLSITNITSVPQEDIPGLAEQMKEAFGCEF